MLSSEAKEKAIIKTTRTTNYCEGYLPLWKIQLMKTC